MNTDIVLLIGWIVAVLGMYAYVVWYMPKPVGRFICWFYGNHWLLKDTRSGSCLICSVEIVNGKRIRPWLHTHIEGADD